MRTVNKIIMSGLTALLMSCSEETMSPDYTGATTEPNTSPIANLTEEQRAILARSFEILVDSSVAVPDSSEVGFDDAYFNTYPFKTIADERYSYPSKDGRRTCDVVTSSDLLGKNRLGVLRAFSYGDKSFVRDPENPYDFSRNETAAIVASSFVEVDGIPVVVTTVGARYETGYWRSQITCSEYVDQFKQSCAELNGLFKDFDDGCRGDYLRLGCASFAPEGLSADELQNIYTEDYKNECKADSISYAPLDDENYVSYDQWSDSTFLNEAQVLDSMYDIWSRENLMKTLSVYRWQFALVERPCDSLGNMLDDEMVATMNESDAYHREFDYSISELSYGYLGILSYNTLPDIEAADAYRKEGVYQLPDSLMPTFFPHLASAPIMQSRDNYYRSKSNAFYMVVIKDVGTKGHLLTNIDASGIYVTDIVKSGNSCPEDQSVHYVAYLLEDSAEWNIVGRPIVKTTYASENWNCDKPETLKKIEPYGEWSYIYGERVCIVDGPTIASESCKIQMSL